MIISFLLLLLLLLLLLPLHLLFLSFSSHSLARVSSLLEDLMENGDSCATCANTIILAETSLGAITQLRDILGRGGRSRWLPSRREAEEVALLVASLSGHCRMEVMEQVDEEMLTFSMEALMTSLVNPATGYLEVRTSTCT